MKTFNVRLPYSKGRGRFHLPRRAVTGLLVVLSLAFLYATAAFAANPAANLDQCANGTWTTPLQCTGAQWQNGNVNNNQAHYQEGNSVPYRMDLSNLTTGKWTLVIGWEVTNGGKHALDYLTSFDRTEHQPGDNPCSGQTCSTANFVQATFPVDPLAPPNCSALAGTSRVPEILLNLFSATGKTSTIDSFSSYLIKNGSTFVAATCANVGSNTTNTIAIRFTTNDPSPVFAWGGHIGTQADWGAGNSAVNIQGSPYHMHLEGFCSDPTGVLTPVTCTTGGSQDRALAASAITSVTMSTQRTPGTGISPGQNVTDTATLTGQNSEASPAGTVSFYICSNTDPTTFPPCTQKSNGTLFDTQTVATTTNTGTATSKAFSTKVSGSYCFLAVYNSTQVQYPSTDDPITSSNTSAECFTISGPTAVTLTDFSARTNDGRGLMVVGLGVLGIAILGSLAFVFARKR